MKKNIKLTRNRNGIFFTQGGKEYNLYDLHNPPKNKEGCFIINGNLDISHMGLTELPDLSECQIDGTFNCSHNPLSSLRGSPDFAEDFICTNTNITDLRGIGWFVHADLSHNKLKSLRGIHDMPESSWDNDSSIDCSHNQITTLRDLPEMPTYLNCSHNNIRTLSDMQATGFGQIDCSFNKLTRLEFPSSKYEEIKESVKESVYALSDDELHLAIYNFVGNPCFEKYAKWLLKARGWSDNATKEEIAALAQLMMLDLPHKARIAIQNTLETSVEAQELHKANKKLFDTKRTLTQGTSTIMALQQAKQTKKNNSDDGNTGR
ncbi:MAG: hypothetical protein Q4C08_03345 [Pseudomonadota bacterium]|nr:hypothetical protein [Pseudomonadota bacterium]